MVQLVLRIRKGVWSPPIDRHSSHGSNCIVYMLAATSESACDRPALASRIEIQQVGGLIDGNEKVDF
jgi:hypothetical protein